MPFVWNNEYVTFKGFKNYIPIVTQKMLSAIKLVTWKEKH